MDGVTDAAGVCKARMRRNLVRGLALHHQPPLSQSRHDQAGASSAPISGEAIGTFGAQTEPGRIVFKDAADRDATLQKGDRFARRGARSKDTRGSGVSAAVYPASATGAKRGSPSLALDAALVHTS
jgi:hypothetical protein